MNKYSLWVASNVVDKKAAGEMYNAIDWMERNAEVIESLVDQNECHPGIQFSIVVDKLVDGIKENEQHRDIIVKWLCEDKKVSYGKILKTKALRKLWKHSNRLSDSHIRDLMVLQDRLQKLEFPPAEIKWLARLIEKRS